MPLAPGDVFAGYTVVRTLGTGGMGAVYLVRHPRLPRHDALKLLRPELSADSSFAARFEREADLVARLSHPNIVSVFDRGTEAGQLWLTMQYVDGHDAEEALGLAGGLLPPDRAVHILTGVAAALDSAHRQSLVHRDVKPANILLQPGVDDEPERVFLTDFGVAKSLQGATKLTMTGAVVATFDYASPEQIESGPLDARSDVYSLGCVLVKLLTGAVPYPAHGHAVAAAIHGHLALPPPRPTERIPWLPPAVDQVVARALAKDRADRYPSCRALAAAAAAAITEFPPAPSPPYTVRLTRHDQRGGEVVVGSMTTDRWPPPETERVVDLVRRTRFFDLPDSLPPPGGTIAQVRPAAGRRVTVEVASGQRVRRVTADLDQAHRPPDLDVLVTTVERLLHSARTAPVPAPATVVSVPVPRRTAPPAPPPPAPVMPDFHRPPPPLAGSHDTGGWQRGPVHAGHSQVDGARRSAPAHGAPGNPTPPTPAPQRPPAGTAPRRRRPLLLAGAGLVIAAVLAVLAVFLLSRDDGDPGTSSGTEASRTPETVTVVVDGTQQWTDAGVDVRAGDRVAVTASGQVWHNEGNSIGPEGFPNRPDLLTPFPELNHAALIGRIGDEGSVFYLGAFATVTAEADGRLYLGVNDGGLENNRGYWDATVAVEPQRA